MLPKREARHGFGTVGHRIRTLRMLDGFMIRLYEQHQRDTPASLARRKAAGEDTSTPAPSTGDLLGTLQKRGTHREVRDNTLLWVPLGEVFPLTTLPRKGEDFS